jgi:hypothetical protein
MQLHMVLGLLHREDLRAYFAELPKYDKAFSVSDLDVELYRAGLQLLEGGSTSVTPLSLKC